MMLKVKVFVCMYTSPCGFPYLKTFTNRKQANAYMNKIWEDHLELYPHDKGKRKEYSDYGAFTFKILTRYIEVEIPMTLFLNQKDGER